MDKNILFRKLPKIDEFLENDIIKNLIEEFGRDRLINEINIQLDRLRDQIKSGEIKEEDLELDRIVESLDQLLSKENYYLKKVINATGTIIHTNLGRSPLNKKHLDHMVEIASGYSNLEYDLESGSRGKREAHIGQLLTEIVGGEDAVVVNNNAAAVFLMINSLSMEREVIISRGEMVEIGGKFRIPDVITRSGGILREVGTTNKTHLSDYEDNINENTGLILKVHTSNYKIQGFTEAVDISDLAALKDQYDLPLIDDLGSGLLADLKKYNILEPTVNQSLEKGADLVSFSGDKLLGGPQCGIILGKKEYIDILKKNPIMRALRVDKFTLSLLEALLLEYKSREKAVENIPILRMIAMSEEEVKDRAMELLEILESMETGLEFQIIKTKSQIGGGALPGEYFDSYGIGIISDMEAGQLQARLRSLEIPIIARVEDGRIILDLRTIDRDDFKYFKQVEGIGK